MAKHREEHDDTIRVHVQKGRVQMMSRFEGCCRCRLQQRAVRLRALLIMSSVCVVSAIAQVNSGSDGHDGVFNPPTNTVIDMADHPDGIYHYSSVFVSNGVTVTFIPNANNTPVTWLVQGKCTISGKIDISGKACALGGSGGPGGFAGGAIGGAGASPGDGLGPGGGKAAIGTELGGSASHATLGGQTTAVSQAFPGEVYGNMFNLPLIGGSGGGGNGESGGGGGGAMLIATSETLQLNGKILANGGSSERTSGAGGGSGGSLRLVAANLSGVGSISVKGGAASYYKYPGYYYSVWAGAGRIRLDALQNNLSGSMEGEVSRGYQPIIIPPQNVAVALTIQTVAGVVVEDNPKGSLLSPDVIVSGNQQNPIPIVVHCSNIPLNTEIIVDVKPANGSDVRAVGVNNVGTQGSSTATVSVNMPRGGGTIQAKAISGIAGNLYGAASQSSMNKSLAVTGWTALGERFASVEVTATLGGDQQVSYITESGRRYSVNSHN